MKFLTLGLALYGAALTYLYIRDLMEEPEAPTVVPDADTLKTFAYRMFDEGAKEIEIKIKNPRFA